MRSIFTTVVFALALTCTGLAGADSSLGTWKYVPARSSSTAPNPPRSRTDVYEAAPDGAVRVTTTEERLDGTRYEVHFTFRYDGKEYPVTGGRFNMISVRRIDPNTTTYEARQTGGKYHQTGTIVVSSDGRTKTQTSAGSNHEGKPVTSTMVYQKQ